MIGASHRFHGHASLNKFFMGSRSVRLSPALQLRYQATNRRTGYRAAVVVSRKVHKSAVVRNRIRRRLYALVGQFSSHFTAAYDLVFIAQKAELATISNTEIQSLISNMLIKAGVMESGPSDPDQARDIVKKASKFS